MSSNSTDLVGRLRAHVTDRGGASIDNGAWQMMLDAADEIEDARFAMSGMNKDWNAAITRAEASETKLREIEASSDRIRDLGDLLARGQCTQPTKVGRELKTIAAAIRSHASQEKK